VGAGPAGGHEEAAGASMAPAAEGPGWAVESAGKVGQRVVICRPSWGLQPRREAAGGFRQGWPPRWRRRWRVRAGVAASWVRSSRSTASSHRRPVWAIRWRNGFLTRCSAHVRRLTTCGLFISVSCVLVAPASCCARLLEISRRTGKPGQPMVRAVPSLAAAIRGAPSRTSSYEAVSASASGSNTLLRPYSQADDLRFLYSSLSFAAGPDPGVGAVDGLLSTVRSTEPRGAHSPSGMGCPSNRVKSRRPRVDAQVQG
jgi:hypothetical protein